MGTGGIGPECSEHLREICGALGFALGCAQADKPWIQKLSWGSFTSTQLLFGDQVLLELGPFFLPIGAKLSIGAKALTRMFEHCATCVPRNPFP